MNLEQMLDTWQGCLVAGIALSITAIVFYFYGVICERLKDNRPDKY